MEELKEIIEKLKEIADLQVDFNKSQEIEEVIKILERIISESEDE